MRHFKKPIGILLPVAFALLFASNCVRSTGKSVIVESFPVSDSIQPVRIINYDPLKINPYTIAKAGKWWLAFLIRNEYAIAITDDSLNVKALTCRQGNGPGEFLWPVSYGTPYSVGDSVIIPVKDTYRGTLNRVAVCIDNGVTDVKKTGDVPVMNRAWIPMPDGSVIVSNNENRYFLVRHAGDTAYFETWGDNMDAKEYEDWWVPSLQTSEIITQDSSRMLIYTDRPYVWLHSTDGKLIRKVYVEHRPDEVREDLGGLGFNSGSLLGQHFLLLFKDLVDEENWTCSTRLMIFDMDMNPEAVYRIAGDCYSFYADPLTGLVYVPDLDEELIRVYDLSEWL